jgi:UDPglucose--hexose-1-phosphate uridylyltransferase
VSPGPCPLCEGHEDDTAPEILAVRGGSTPNGQGWLLRVVPNGVPVLRTEQTFAPRTDELLTRADGLGAHEVFVESPRHDASWQTMDVAAIARVLEAWRDRICDLGRDSRLRSVIVFKNHGPQAGARFQHPHSQLMAMPVVPPALADEVAGAARHHAATGRCVYCDLVASDLADSRRLVTQQGHAVAVAPFAARTPFALWVMPRAHASDFGTASADILTDVAAVLRTLAVRIASALDDPDVNIVLHTAPYGPGAAASYHWHVEVIPRVFRVTGFDLGTGTSVNPVSPEEAARVLGRPAPGD